MAVRPPPDAALTCARDDLFDGRYRLTEALGRGGTATVWRAYDERMGRPVAVKVLADGVRRPSQRSRDEAQALARLSHRHIAGVYDYGDTYIVLEFVDGPSLAGVLREREMPLDAAIAAGAQIASALAAAHGRGIVHRDVTPSNIMLTAGGVKLIDFGISAVSGGDEVDVDGGLRGTPAFAAPERLDAGAAVVDAQSDMYSFGVVLYRMLSGRMPLGRDVLPPVPGLSDALTDLCTRCVARDPAVRPTAAEAAAVLAAAASEDALARFTASTVEPVDPVTQVIAHRPAPRHGVRRTVAVGALAALVWIAGWAAIGWGPASSPAGHDAVAGAAVPSPALANGRFTNEAALTVAVAMLGAAGTSRPSTVVVVRPAPPTAPGNKPPKTSPPKTSPPKTSPQGNAFGEDNGNGKGNGQGQNR